MKAISVAGALLFAVVTATGQQATRPPQTGALAPGGTGLLAGRVVDPVSGRAVSDAVVWLLIDGVLRPESPRVMTDTAGGFVFVNVPAGRYSFQAQKSGYSRGLLGARTVLSEGRDLELAEGQILTDVALPLWKHAAIGGTVTDEAGEPVVGVVIRAFRKTVAFGEIRFTPDFRNTTAMTDDRGQYRFSSLAPGEFIVAVPSTLTTFPAEVMPEVSRRDIQTEAFRAISELSPIGGPANQQIGPSVIMSGNHAVVPPAPSDDVTGVYRTTLFPDATRPADATAVSLRAGEERSGVDVRLRPVRAARVSGRIAGPDGVASPTAVRLIPAGESVISVSRGLEVATGLSDAAGRFTLLGVPEGQYVALVERRLPASAGEQTLLYFASEPVGVGSGAATDVVLTVQRAPSITVKLGTRDGQTPKPLTVLVEPIGGNVALEFEVQPREPTITQLVPGRYVVTPYTTGTSCTAMCQGRDVSDEALVLTDADVELTIVCGEPPTRLSGTVRDERGSVDDNAVAIAFPAERRFWSGAELRARRKVSAFTSASGAFSMSNLPPGEYLVAALPIEGSDFWQDPKVLDKLTSVATRVVLGAGESRMVDVRTVRPR
jgi:hypothetical protein